MGTTVESTLFQFHSWGKRRICSTVRLACTPSSVSVFAASSSILPNKQQLFLLPSLAGDTSLLAASNHNDVLSKTDIFYGLILALVLASLPALLRRLAEWWSTNDDEWTTRNNIPQDQTNSTTRTFDDWSDMARPDNYVWYKKRRREQGNEAIPNDESSSSRILTLAALLSVFVPIFLAEIFLALSRALVCDTEFGRQLCQPYTF